MKIRVKVKHRTCVESYELGIFEGKKMLMRHHRPPWSWQQKKAAIRNAKAMAKRIGIPYDPEIIQQHGC